MPFAALVKLALILGFSRRNGEAARLRGGACEDVGLFRSVIVSKAATVVQAASLPNTGV
jgi:hypothetical protein